MVEKDRLLELVVPDFSKCKLKPYVAAGAKRHVIQSSVQL